MFSKVKIPLVIVIIGAALVLAAGCAAEHSVHLEARPGGRRAGAGGLR